MSASSFIRIAAGFALFLALAVSARGDGIEVPFFTMKGEVGVADLKLAGIGSGSAPARTGQGPLVVKPSDVRMQPDGFFVTASSSGPVLLELMGSSLIDLNSFDQRLLAALRGDATLPPLRTVELEGPAASSFNPSAGLGSRSKSRGTGGARQQRPRKPGRDSSSGSGGASSGGPKFTVYATAEGLIGGHTSSGLVIQQWTEGVALPDPSALHRKTHVVYLKNHRDADATVYDVGPWNINDPYWRNPNGHPQAESGRDRTGRTTNRAGIDLMNGTWYKLLGLRSYDKHLIESTSGEVTWWFVN